MFVGRSLPCVLLVWLLGDRATWPPWIINQLLLNREFWLGRPIIQSTGIHTSFWLNRHGVTRIVQLSRWVGISRLSTTVMNASGSISIFVLQAVFPVRFGSGLRIEIRKVSINGRAGKLLGFVNWATGEPGGETLPGFEEHYAFIFPSQQVYDARWKDTNDLAASDWEDIGRWVAAPDLPVGAFGLVEVPQRIEGAVSPDVAPKLTAKKTADTLELTWKTEAGKRHQLQFSDITGSVRWHNVGVPIEGKGEVVAHSEPLMFSQSRFYRVLVTRP